MLKAKSILILLLVGALSAAAGTAAVWVAAEGMLPYQVPDSARSGFTAGLEEAGLEVLPQERVYAVNTVIDPASTADLSTLAAMLSCDFIGVISIKNDGDDYLLHGSLYDGFNGELIDGDTSLVDQLSTVSRLAERIAQRLAEDLPTCGPLFDPAADWSTAMLALGSADDVQLYDYGWVYRYGEPMTHPDTGASLGVGIEILGALRVAGVRGAELSVVALSEPLEGYEYSKDVRVRMFTPLDYQVNGFERGLVVDFSRLGFGEEEDVEVELPHSEPADSELAGVEIELLEILRPDYAPLALDLEDDLIAVLGDDEVVRLYPGALKNVAPLESTAADCDGLALLDGDLYLADSWSSTIYRRSASAAGADREPFTAELSVDVLASGADGNLWASTFSYSVGWDSYTYPALRLGRSGDVVEARALDVSGSVESLTAAPDGTVYYLSSFNPVKGLSGDGTTVERGARMLQEPRLLDCNTDGLLAVWDGEAGLVVFDAAGRIMGRWTGSGVLDPRNIDDLAFDGRLLALGSNWDGLIALLELDYVYEGE